jgi:hypothetical protein
MSIPNFIHFGCWNKGGCLIDSPDFNPLSRVMKNLREVCEDETTKPEFVVVAGDNYYPDTLTITTDEKKIKGKNINTRHLDSGLECLPNNVPVNIILGNHDVESDVLVDYQIPAEAISFPEVPEQQKCYILDKQIEFAGKRQDIGTTLDVYASRIFNHETLVLMIDTTLYYDEEKIGLKCYRHYYEDDSLTLTEIRNKQKTYVEDTIHTLNDKIKNIVIIGHDPIICYKVKRGETITIVSPGYNLINLLYVSIYKNIPRNRNLKFYYLCADLHQYQIGSVKIEREDDDSMDIKQYIVGTGGTDLDDYPFTSSDQSTYERYDENVHLNGNPTEYKIEYSLTPEQISLSRESYGFLQCYDIDGSLAFNFIDTANDPRVNVRETMDNDALTRVHVISGGRKRKNNKKNSNISGKRTIKIKIYNRKKTNKKKTNKKHIKNKKTKKGKK